MHVASASDLQGWAAYAGCADFLLFDTKCPTAGGSGRQFDWTALDSYDGSLPFLLSGGIGPDDADRIAGLCHPMMAGIDINSRFETAPAVKDATLIGRFIGRLRSAETTTLTQRLKQNKT